MSKSLAWKNNGDKRDVVHLVVQALVEGHVVALPTETTYQLVASALNEHAVSRLAELQESGMLAAPSLLLRSAEEAFDYSPGMSLVARRAVYRGWPGPLILELPIHQSEATEKSQIEREASLAYRFPKVSQQLLLTDETFLKQRVTAHEAIHEAMRLTPGPLIAAPCLAENGSPISEPSGVEERFGQHCTFLVDDGQTHFGGYAARVRVEENRCSLMERGVLEQAKLNQLFHLVVLVVCTGNTCRSPMAEVLLKQLLRKRFPDLDGEEDARVFVASAGLSAYPGGPASVEAQCVMEKRGLSLRNHQSRGVTAQSLMQADLILTMTRGHREAILQQLPDLENRVHLVSGSNVDVSDPFGGPEALYEDCADQIEGFLQAWVERMDVSWFPNWRFEAD